MIGRTLDFLRRSVLSGLFKGVDHGSPSVQKTTKDKLSGVADRKFIRYAFIDNGQSDMKLRYPDINDSLTPVLARKMLLTRLGPEDPDHNDDQGVALETSKPELKQPPLYRRLC